MIACSFEQVPHTAFAPFTVCTRKYASIILAMFELEDCSILPSVCLSMHRYLTTILVFSVMSCL